MHVCTTGCKVSIVVITLSVFMYFSRCSVVKDIGEESHDRRKVEIGVEAGRPVDAVMDATSFL